MIGSCIIAISAKSPMRTLLPRHGCGPTWRGLLNCPKARCFVLRYFESKPTATFGMQ